MTRIPGQPRKPGGGFKKTIAKLQARVAELEQELGESQRRDHEKCLRCPFFQSAVEATDESPVKYGPI
ncbi:hypothetical protein LJC15_00070 [Desulfovibrio sp. OttesenSCG-928-G11]|nr:hypothetical protein [Desulfovibrio sp. OttesenSCG-928-G11]